MSEISNAIKQICREKGLSYEAVLGTIEAALAAAYRKDFGSRAQNIKVNFDPEDASLKVFDVKTVVEDLPTEEDSGSEKDSSLAESQTAELAKEKNKKAKEEKPTEAKSDKAAKTGPGQPAEGQEPAAERRFNPRTEIQLSDALLIKSDAKVGDELKLELEVPGEFGRMAAQTAKQVIIQKLHEAERNMIYEEFKSKENEVVSGIVQRREGRVVLVDLGKAVGILPPEEQIANEAYTSGTRLKVYVKSVEMGSRGPEIILSRTSEEILKKVFYLEIPEIANGLIEIKAVAREAGSRAKVAVASEYENVDPIGSCVGQRGSRIQTIINELGGEKIDIIEYDEEPQKFIANALSPAKILNMEIDPAEKQVTVIVSPDQFSLAIGKNGQNVRLAARLTGWKIDIAEAKDKTSPAAAKSEEAAGSQAEENQAEEKAKEGKDEIKNESKENKDKNGSKAEAKDKPEPENKTEKELAGQNLESEAEKQKNS